MTLFLGYAYKNKHVSSGGLSMVARFICDWAWQYAKSNTKVTWVWHICETQDAWTWQSVKSKMTNDRPLLNLILIKNSVSIDLVTFNILNSNLYILIFPRIQFGNKSLHPKHASLIPPATIQLVLRVKKH